MSHHVLPSARPRASIKALQLPANSGRGLIFAQWRLTYNAICLPVLTYSMATNCGIPGSRRNWSTNSKPSKTEASDWQPALFGPPRESSYSSCFNIFPIDLSHRMLTDNSALRLYRLHKSSKVLLRRGGDLSPNPREPISTPARRSAKTPFHVLASGLCQR